MTTKRGNAALPKGAQLRAAVSKSALFCDCAKQPSCVFASLVMTASQCSSVAQQQSGCCVPFGLELKLHHTGRVFMRLSESTLHAV